MSFIFETHALKSVFQYRVLVPYFGVFVRKIYFQVFSTETLNRRKANKPIVRLNIIICN